jgi:hypothetical protein
MKAAAIENTRGSFVTRNLRSVSGEDDRGRPTVESEVGIASLQQHLLGIQRAVVNAVPPEMMAVLISPLCSVVPKILSACAKQLSVANSSDDEMALVAETLKTRFLRAISACQHVLSSLLEDSKLEPRTHRLLQDIASEDFELCRRVADIIDHPVLNETAAKPQSSLQAEPRPIKAEDTGKSSLQKVPSDHKLASAAPARSNSSPSRNVGAIAVGGTNKMEKFFESVAAKFNK